MYRKLTCRISPVLKRRLTGVGIMLVSLLVFGILAEIVLRIAGYKSYETHFMLVDEIEAEDRFFTDETGILRMNAGCDLWGDISINAEGFRDAELAAQLALDRPRIMFVGDSFTYGASAVPKSEAFTDLIEQHGYTAFNFGVAGTGPMQYAAITEQYLPIVEPDLLAIMLYLGDDINRFPARLEPNKVTHYATNAGMIYAYDASGRHMDFEQACSHHFGGRLRRLEYWARKSVVLGIVAKGVVGVRNRILMGRRRKGHAKGGDRNQYVIDALTRIKTAAQAQGTRYCIFLIPTKPSMRSAVNRYENAKYIFKGFETVYTDFAEEEYRVGRDPHIDNVGHAQMAEIVRKVFEDTVLLKD